ncbi:YqzL family protein [Caldalkalibacillus salinus]|uniref:YqzL family protein n=1 Tax=Caldalkalibacillus salinus TaxID=2803787 RepID=UPI001923F030|nr:YqzL family protein [Caldalkalibacillus salinus]
MRDYSWNVFSTTGNVEAYLLYKECTGTDCQDHDEHYEKDVEFEEEKEVSIT